MAMAPLSDSNFSSIESDLIDQFCLAVSDARNEDGKNVTPIDPHHLSVARKLDGLFADTSLTMAGLLHGVEPHVVSRLPLDLHPDVLRILECWKLLRRRSHVSEAEAQLPSHEDVVGSLRDPRAAALLAIERLDRWDPNGDLLGWTQDFCYNPSTLSKNTLRRISKHSKNLTIGHKKYFYDQGPSFLSDIAAVAAEQLGLWDIRNTLRNLAFLAANERHFLSIIDRCIESMDRDAMCDSIVDSVKVCLPDSAPTARWRWHHVASIGQTIPENKSLQSARIFSQAGFVVLEGKNASECYSLLGELHQAPDVKVVDGHIRDRLSVQKPDGSRALSTRIEVKSHLYKRTVPVTVRFVLKNTKESPWRKVLSDKVHNAPTRSNCIRVFTPKGAPREIPAGSTVLNFAASIHMDFIGLVDYALVNGETQVDQLHRLKNEDYVQVYKANSLQMPPDGWEGIPEASRIRHLLRKNFEPKILELGIRRLKLIIYGTEDPPDFDEAAFDLLIDMTVEQANDAVFSSRKAIGRNRTYWLQKFGIREADQSGIEHPFSFSLRGEVNHRNNFKNQERENRFIACMRSLITSLDLIEDGLDLSPDQRLKHRRIEVCGRCKPVAADEFSITTVDSTGTLHRRGAPCDKGGVPVNTTKRFSVHQVFHIEAKERIGLVTDILSIFFGEGATIPEVVARRISPEYSVIRVEVDMLLLSQISRIHESLKAEPGIIRVFPPKTEPNNLLLSQLPPRRVGLFRPLRGEPYVCGGEVADTSQFYGRGNELRELKEELITQRKDARPSKGATAFLTGPLKVGKSSLAMRFIHDLNMDQRPSTITAYLTVPLNTDWESIERDILVPKLQEAIREFNRRSGTDIAVKDTVVEMLAEVRLSKDAPTVLIVVDEAMRVFGYADNRKRTQDCAEAINSLLKFSTSIQNNPGSLLLWIGPEAGTLSIASADLLTELRSARKFRLSALSEKDTRNLLSASNRFSEFQLSVSKDVARRAWRLAQGNPYWLNHLGAHMWRNRGQKKSGVWTYTEGILDEAARQIIVDDDLFFDRFSRQADYKNLSPEALAVLRFLIESQSENQSSKFHNLPTLLSYLSKIGLNVTAKILMPQLETFVARGGLRKDGRDRYGIYSPLLGEWLLRSKFSVDVGITQER